MAEDAGGGPGRAESPFSALDESFRRTLPLHCLVSPLADPGKAVVLKTAPCTHHHTQAYDCHPFHKPVSRVLARISRGPEEDV